MTCYYCEGQGYIEWLFVRGSVPLRVEVAECPICMGYMDLHFERGS